MAEMTLSPGWATYLRVSDEDKQTPERSFAMQRQRIQERLLSDSKLPVHREYRDMVTGTSAKRADYQQLLKDAEEGCYSHLGLYQADRFGRNTVEGLRAATKLIGLGVRIRVANMPSLQPETPDGFFMFVLQMGLAQREVDVLRQRTRDGMEAKLRAGGWPAKAPDGYLNKERLVSSNKYHRWVEIDPARRHILREAWDLLLTERYTLIEICEELTATGYTRGSGKPWAWTDTKSGRRKQCFNYLSKIFHNAFYAGWVTSDRFGIKYGEIRGKWEPIITTSEYERGLEILRRRDAEKSRAKKHFYLLQNLLWVKINGRPYKLYCSTPSGRSRRYSYYITHAKPRGRKERIRCKDVDPQIPNWLRGITIDPELVPALREVYRDEIEQVTHADRNKKMEELQRQLTRLREEEAQMVRMFIGEKMSEETYDQLRAEWQEKVRHIEANLADLERDAARYVNDLDMALLLLTQVATLYQRLEEEEGGTLLQILAKRIIVNLDGEIMDHELHSPFAYLRTLVDGLPQTGPDRRGSEQFHQGAHTRSAPDTVRRVFDSAGDVHFHPASIFPPG